MHSLGDVVAQVESAAAELRNRVPAGVRTAVLFGKGGPSPESLFSDVTALADWASGESVRAAPPFAVATIGPQPVLVLNTLPRLEDGRTAHEVAFPVRVLGRLPIERIVLVETALSVSGMSTPGDLVLITDHLNLQGQNPLSGPNQNSWGSRFPDMTQPFDVALRTLASEAGVDLHEGIYAGVRSVESDIPCSDFRLLGADVVGAGLIPEVIAARHMDIRVVAVTIVVGRCGEHLPPPNHTDALLADLKRVIAAVA